MTVSSETSKVTYLGDGDTAQFAIPFYFLANGEVKVVHKDASGLEATWLEGTHYEITGAGLADGGMLSVETTPTDYTPDAGERLIIKRDLDFVQETDYPEGGQFPAVAHERALDRLVMLCQQLDEEISRTLRLAESSSVANLVVPEPAAGKALVWNGDETGLENAAVDTANAIVATSTTSLAIGTGSKSFTTQPDKSFAVGTFVMATSDADPTVDHMFGQVTAYSGTSLTVDVAAVGGAGTRSDWTIRLAGARGATGAAGATGPAGANGLFAGSEPTVTAALADLFALKDASDGNNPKFATLQTVLDAVNLLTEDAAPDLANDFVPIFDSSGAIAKKVKPLNLGGSLPKSYLAGFVLSNNSGDPANDIDIAAGECRDATDAADMVLAGALTKRLDAAWTVGTNQGGLDTGSIADAVYAVWLIKRPDTGVVDALFSTSFSSPTMPASYDHKRLIGAIARVSGSIKAFTQYGEFFRYTTEIQDASGSSAASADTWNTVTCSVPPSSVAQVKTWGYSYWADTDSSDGDIRRFTIGGGLRPSGSSDTGASVVSPNMGGGLYAFTGSPAIIGLCPVDSSRQLQVMQPGISVAGADVSGGAYAAYTLGFILTQRSNP